MKLMELYKNKIMGKIKSLDRIRFRGTIRWLANNAGMKVYLAHSHILLKDFARWANDITLRVRKSRERRAVELGIEMRPRKCVWIYHYFNDPELGFGHVRLQTWSPLNVFICLNGRHRLELSLQKNRIGYVKDGNCFPWIEDIRTAQELMDKEEG